MWLISAPVFDFLCTSRTNFPECVPWAGDDDWCADVGLEDNARFLPVSLLHAYEEFVSNTLSGKLVLLCQVGGSGVTRFRWR